MAKPTHTAITVSKRTHTKLAARAARECISIAELVERLINVAIEEEQRCS